jgi:hypothetical protein
MDAARLATALNAGRIAIGLALLVSPVGIGRRWLGPAVDQPATQVALRTMGIRDAALGAATIGTLRATGVRGTGFAVLAGLGIAVDLVDAGATAAAWSDLPSGGKAVVGAGLTAAGVGAAVLANR